MTRCKNGYRKNKFRECQRKDTFKRRCKNGTRKYPPTGECKKYPFNLYKSLSRDSKLKLLRQQVKDAEREVHEMLDS